MMKHKIVEIHNFSFAYPGGKESLKNINLSIEEGSLNVLCGKSGCGKSTLLRQLKSVLAPHGKKSGEILYCGRLLDETDRRTQSSEIGFVLQDPDNQLVTDKVWHELAFGLESLGYDTPTIRLRVAEMASYFGIQNWFMKNVAELSGGQKQLLNLASIMAMHPRLLILDEPASQLDPIAASDFLETVKRINRDISTTVILTEHRLQDVIPWADHVIVMDEGTILTEGTPREIGKKLKQEGHGMFLSMPVPMQIYMETDSEEECPLTISEGRRWMSRLLENKTPVIVQPHEEHEVKDEAVKGKKRIFVSWQKKDRQIPAVTMEDVWFRYEKDYPDVICGMTMQVEKGEFYALMGGNGTGKSTALSLLGRVRRPYRGKILLNGKDIRKYSDTELYRGYLGILPQNPQSMFVKNTVEKDLYAVIGGRKEKQSAEYPIDMKKSEAIGGIVSLMHLEGLLDRHPYDLSGGEQQRLALAKILLLRPRLLLMDEPTKGMDAEYKKELGQILKKLQSHGITIFMVSHDVEFVVEYAGRVGLFFEGNVVTDKPAREFFAGNYFYTTAANRMARHYFPDAVTGKDVVKCLKTNLWTDL